MAADPMQADRAGRDFHAMPEPAADATPRVRVTHGERVIDRGSGLTKLDLVRYYDSVAEAILPQLRGRAVALLRAPRGVGGPVFFQKHAQPGAFAGVRQLDAALWPGHEALLEIHSREGLLGAAQMNVIEFHTWNSRTRAIGKPDRIVFDLDPGEGVAWAAVREGAVLLRSLLDQLGLRAWLKTSGGKGLHLAVPIAARWPFDTVKGFCQAVVQHLADTLPQRFVARSGPDHRVGRIFIDYLRNGLGATTVAAYSARARPGLGVSMPLAWDELDTLAGSAAWSVTDAAAWLVSRGADPWADMGEARQSLTAPMQRLGYRPS
jgi:bifunctional non-homologous end joining protein LigD